MTVFQLDGFESYGESTTPGADVQTRFAATNRQTFFNVSGGHSGDISLIDDFESVGLAIEMPEGDSARAEYLTYEFPDGTTRHADYKVPANASSPDFASGFRFYNPDLSSQTLTNTIWGCLTSSTSAGSVLRINPNSVDLEFVDANSNVYTGVAALTKDAWHYIEIEFKMTTSGNGGSAKVYVDNVEVIDTGPVNIVTFSFFNTWGTRIGLGTISGSQSGGGLYAFDDMYTIDRDGVDHTERLGPVRIVALSPTSDDTPNDWSPDSGGNNFSRVANLDWETTSYVEADVTGDDDHYGITALSSTTDVHAVRLNVVAEATNGTPDLHIGIDNGTADEEDMGTLSTGGEVQNMEVFEVDPSGAAWTESNVNSAEYTQRMTE